jgi:hypothetical protein
MSKGNVRKKGKPIQPVPPVKATHIDETTGAVIYDRTLNWKENEYIRKKIESFIKKKGRK